MRPTRIYVTMFQNSLETVNGTEHFLAFQGNFYVIEYRVLVNFTVTSK